MSIVAIWPSDSLHHVGLVLEHRCLVSVDVQVVRRRENGHDRREPGRLGLAVHAVTGVLRLVRSNDREQVVTFQKVASGGIAVISASASRS